MRNTLQMTGTSESNHQRKALNVTLWIIQVLLALVFIATGVMKLITPIQELLAQMPLPLPGLFVRFIGLAELSGALGLILPGLLHMRRGLTPLAALGLLIVMCGATVFTIIGMGIAPALMPVLLGLLCICVARGRRSWFRTA